MPSKGPLYILIVSKLLFAPKNIVHMKIHACICIRTRICSLVYIWDSECCNMWAYTLQLPSGRCEVCC